MTEFTYEQLREQKGFKLLKVGDILRWHDRRNLIMEECGSHEYPLLAMARIGVRDGKVSFQISHYKVELVFKDELFSYFGPVIGAEQTELYAKAERKMTRAGITNETETRSLQDDWRRARAEVNLLKILEEK